VITVISALAAFVLLGFSVGKVSNAKRSGLDVEMLGDPLIRFVTAEDIRQHIEEDYGHIQGKAVTDIDLQAIEMDLSDLPHIDRVEVYRTIDHRVQVKAEQRVPLFRWVDRSGITGYVDSKGDFLQLSKAYVHPCIPVTGDFGFSSFPDDNMDEAHILSSVRPMMEFISADGFWSAQILQLDVQEDGELVMIPRVGNHEIVMGSPEGYEEKFKKLKAFYEEGITQTNWNLYRRLDLRFEDQVVCTRR